MREGIPKSNEAEGGPRSFFKLLRRAARAMSRTRTMAQPTGRRSGWMDIVWQWRSRGFDGDQTVDPDGYL